jgi:hypothetical protein
LSNLTPEFEDDSSAALSLSHGHRGASDRVAQYAGGIQTFDLEERAKIEAVMEAKFQKAVDELIVEKQWTRKQAEEFVRGEKQLSQIERKNAGRELAADRQRKATEKLMGLDRKVSGSGSKSRGGRRKNAKWICQDCHLEFCEHRPKRGRPKGNRTEQLKGRVSKQTRAILKENGISATQALEITAKALMTGRTYESTLAEWKANRRMVA